MIKKLRKSLSDEIKSAVIYLHIGLGTLILLSLGSYIFLFTESSQFGNRVEQTQAEMSNLEATHDILAIKALDAQTSDELITDELNERVRVEPIFVDSRLHRLTKAN